MNIKQLISTHPLRAIFSSLIVAVFLIGAYIITSIFGGSYGGTSYDMAVGGSPESVNLASSKIAIDGAILPPDFVPALGDVKKNDERKIIQNGSLSLVVKSTESTISEIRGIAEMNNGFVDGSNIWETGDGKKAGSITIRVSGELFNKVMSDIKSLAIKVTREDTSARDVTEEFIDVEANLSNLKAEEAQYRIILNKATSVEDILSVRRELTNIRGQIDSLQGRLNYLSRQVDMSSISVSLVSEADVQVFGVVWSPLQTIKEGIRDMLQSIVSFVDVIIAFIFFLPAIILWLLAIGFVLWIIRKGYFRIMGKKKSRKNN